MDMTKYEAAMSPKYRELWNADVQKKIDRDIEANRKADGRFMPEGVPAGAEVNVEQVKSEFVFGAHIFNFDQLGSDERNEEDIFGWVRQGDTISEIIGKGGYF